MTRGEYHEYVTQELEVEYGTHKRNKSRYYKYGGSHNVLHPNAGD